MNDQFDTLTGQRPKPGLMSLDNLEYDDVLRAVLRRVYLVMTLGLLTTAAAAYFGAFPFVQGLIFGTPFLFYGLIIAELILVIVLTAAINKLSAFSAAVLFFFYAAINGLTLSTVFLVYSNASIVMAFVITASLFGAMTLIGYSTKKNLDNWRGYLLVGLIAMLILSIVNIFMGSSQLEWVISIVLVFIFLGLTIYDTQRIKRMVSYNMHSGDPGMLAKLGMIGALRLYLDFVNLFLRILRIFGRRRN